MRHSLNGGNVALTASDVVALSSDSLTTANAGLNGNGGDVTVFSPDTALFWTDATIEAKGGTITGNGGFVEVSGRQNVYIRGWVDASAPKGSAGTFLIDPTDITIQDAAGDITDDGDGTFTSTANANTISDDTIEGYLVVGTSVTLDTSDQTGGPYLGNGDITQNADAQINKGAGGAATLTLIAERDIVLNGGIDSTVGSLGVVLTATGNVDLNAAVTTNGGTFTSSGVNFDNTGGAITTNGAKVDIQNTGDVTVGAQIQSNGGDISVASSAGDIILGDIDGILTAGIGGVTVAALDGDIRIADSTAGVEVSGSGTVTIAAKSILKSGSASVENLDVSNATALVIADKGLGDIQVREQGTSTINSTGITVANASSGNIDITYQGGDAVQINDGHEIGTTTLDHNFSYTAEVGSITDSGTVTLTGTTASFTTGTADDTITLDNQASTAAFSFTTNGIAGHVVLDNGTTNLDLGASSVAGNLEVTSGGTISQSGSLNVAGTSSFVTNVDDKAITLDDTGNALTGTVSFTTQGTAGHVTLDNGTTGLDLGTLNIAGDLDVITGGEITQSDSLSVSGSSSFTTNVADQAITLDDESNTLSGTVSFNTTGGGSDQSHVTFDSGDTALELGSSSVYGDLDIIAGEAITQSGALSVAGTSSFITDVDDKAITLDDTGNALTGTASFTTQGTAGHVTLDNGTTGLDLGTLDIAGNLDVASGGAITQSDSLTVTGTSRFVTNVDDKAITLDDTGNALDGAVRFITQGTEGHVTLDNGTTDLNLMTSNIAGDFDVITGGAITQSGALLVEGTSSFTTDVADKAIAIDDILNEFNGATSLNTLGTGSATMVNTIGVDMAASNVGGSLDVTAATGDITDSGLVSVGGNASFTTSNANDDIDLGTLAVTGAIDLSTSGGTGNATIVNTIGVDLAALNIGGSLDVTATTGDLEINDSVTAGGTISMEATAGAITQSAGTITANGGSLSLKSNGDLDMADYTVAPASLSSTDLILDSTGGSAIVTGSAADNWKSITAAAQSNVVLAGDGDITIGNLESRSTSGLNGVQISTDTGSGGSLDAQGTITSGGFVDVDVEGSASFADTVTAGGNIELEAGINLEINDNLTATGGGVSLISETGKIYTPGGSNDTLNVAISGYSAPGVGVELPGPGVGVAAISIRSALDLIIGDSAELIASGTYTPGTPTVDDRLAVGFDPSLSAGADPIDIEIYLRSYRLDGLNPIGTVTVGSKVTIADNGTMVIDAGEKVIFNGDFYKSVFNTSTRLEVVSRRSETLGEVITYDRLPHADDPESIRNFFNETSTGYFAGAYVLRGVKTLLAEVLALTNPVPLVPPRTLEPEFSGEVEGPDTDALVNLLSELGIGVQPYVTEAYADFLSTDLRLYKAAEKLQGLMPILEETDGTRIAGLRKAVAQYFPTLDSLSEEQMESFTQILENHKGDGTDFDLAGQCIFALREYVNILSTEIGWPVEKSVEFVMGRYVPRITENDEIRIAVIQMHLQK